MKAKLFKKLSYVLIFFFVLMEVGCMNDSDGMRTTGDKAINYINEKYQMNFTPVTYEMSNILSETDIVHCRTDEMDEKNEHIEIYLQREDGKTVYSDNYFGFHIRPEAEAYIGTMVGSEFSEYKVFRENHYQAFPNELTSKNTLEDLYRVYPDYWMNVKVYLKADPSMSEDEYAEKIQHIEQQLIDSGHRFTISICALGETAYNAIDRFTQDDFWVFYAGNRQPDHETYYYMYKNLIVDGGII